MIVVVIIGILAAVAIPRFVAANTKSKQNEAKTFLRQIHAMEKVYFEEHKTYWGGLEAAFMENVRGSVIVYADKAEPDRFSYIGVQIPSNARYTYSIEASKSSFNVIANCPNPGLDDDPTPDTWMINEEGILTCTSDDSKD